MEVGYKEVVLTLQDIMESDAELKYLTKERNFVHSTISKICCSTKEEISDQEVYRNCTLIKRSTVELLENSGYNLFRQFETSFDCKYFDRSATLLSDNEGSETYVPTYIDKFFHKLIRHAIITSVDYTLDIYCYVLPPSPRRSSFGPPQIYISTYSLQNSSFQNSSLRDSSLQNSSLRDSSFQNSSLQDSSIRDSSLQDSSLRDSFHQNCSLRDSSLQNSSLQDSSLRDFSLQDSSLQDSSLRDSSLRDASLRDSSHRDSSHRDSSLRDSSLRDSSFRDAFLRSYPETLLLDDPMNLNALEASQLVWHDRISSIRDRSNYLARTSSASGYCRKRDSIWGSTSTLPTTLMEPLCDLFWDNLFSDDDNSDADEQMGGVFLKLTTLHSSARRSISSSGVSTEDESETFSFTDENGVESAVSHDHESYISSVERTASGRNGKPSDSDVVNCVQTVDFNSYERRIDVENLMDLKSDDFETSVDDKYASGGECRLSGCSNNTSMSTQEGCSEDPSRKSSSTFYCTHNNSNSIIEEFQNLFCGDVSHLLLKDIQQESNQLQIEKDARLPPLNVPLLWSRKCEDLQSFLALEVAHPSTYIQEYKRIRRSKLNLFDCLRSREYAGKLNQTRVLEVIARQHYNIFPPADYEDLERSRETSQMEEDTDLIGYLMVSLETRRTFDSYPLSKYGIL